MAASFFGSFLSQIAANWPPSKMTKIAKNQATSTPFCSVLAKTGHFGKMVENSHFWSFWHHISGEFWEKVKNINLLFLRRGGQLKLRSPHADGPRACARSVAGPGLLVEFLVIFGSFLARFWGYLKAASFFGENPVYDYQKWPKMAIWTAVWSIGAIFGGFSSQKTRRFFDGLRLKWRRGAWFLTRMVNLVHFAHPFSSDRRSGREGRGF